MTKIFEIARMFRDEEDGAAMVEYSILIGIIAAASILTIIAIGLWVSGQFTYLCDQMGTHNGVTCGTASPAPAPAPSP